MSDSPVEPEPQSGQPLGPAEQPLNSDRRRVAGVGDAAHRVARLAVELRRHALAMEGQSTELFETLDALDSATEELERQSAAMGSSRWLADRATARLARLQRITAALSNTVTQDAVADSVLGEAIVALECDAGAFVVTGDDEAFVLVRESGSLDAVMESYRDGAGTFRTPYRDAVERREAIYLESFEALQSSYPGFGRAGRVESYGAWTFLPLEIAGTAVGALSFGFADSREFNTVDRQFADTVSRYCAQALDRVRLRVAAAAALSEASDARMMAEHANNAKTVFLRAMSHELRTPLNAIAGYTELLQLGIRGPVNADQTKDLGRIKRAAAYLLRLINDVLTVARLEGARPLNLASVSVNAVLSEVEGLCAIQARANNIALTVVPSPVEIFVSADPERVQQILLNLITNAVKFTLPGGAIRLTVDADALMVRVHVIDTGVGIRPVDLDRVFETFVQIDRHLTSATQQGVGLGLSISRELARGMHGDLTLRSAEGVGSTFTLELPLAARPAA